MKKRNLFAILAVTAAMTASALDYTSLVSPSAINSPAPAGYLSRGLSMFSQQNYTGTLDQLRQAAKSRQLTDDERSLLEYCQAMAVFNADGPQAAMPMLQAWLDKWPMSTHRADVMMSVADCLFVTNYAEALKAYSEIDPLALADMQRRQDLIYRQAYCLLKVADYDRAMALFDKLQNSAAYADAAKFYKAYIHYAKGDMAQARQAFAQVNTATQPGCMADYYLSQIYYLDGDYDRALSTARNLLRRNDVDPAFVAEARRIAGESLFLTGRVDQAIPYLEQYVQAVESPLSSTMFMLGISQYNTAQYDKAIATLQPVSADNSAMGQNALVYLGQAMLKQGNTNGAIMAFDRALKMHHDPQAAENAFYNYAVARYAGGNVPFGSAVTVFEQFLANYPDSRHADQVRQYVINGYLTDNNYEAALASIDRVANPSAQVLQAKQRVLYTLGARQLSAGNAADAVRHLRQAKALSHHNPQYAAETDLALGEALYRTGDYKGAVSQLQAFLANPGDASAHNKAVAQFDLGYALMAQKDWSHAEKAFEGMMRHKSAVSADIVADAWNRIGDCRYYSKDWKGAAAAYDQAYATVPAAGDYALFQKAMMNGYAGNFSAKLADMRHLADEFPTSSLRPDAMLEMTEAQLRLGDTDGAIAVWKQLIDKYPQTQQGRQAYLQMALTLANTGHRDQATEAYKAIVTKYPTSDEAAQAAEIMKRQAADAGTLDDYRAFMAAIDNAPQIDDSEAERLSWNAALDRVDSGKDYSRVADYAKRYPNGKYTAQAYTLLMDNARQAGDTARAAEYGRALVTGWPDADGAAGAYAAMATQAQADGRMQDAMTDWQKAASRASTAEQATVARAGLMRTARQLLDAEVLQQAAQTVLNSTADGLGLDMRTEAAYSLGLAQNLQGNAQDAIKTWSAIAGDVDNEYGSQAAVAMAQAQLDSGDAQAAAKTATAFTDSDTPYPYWLARGFIVLSDALRAQGQAYDADEYLRAVRDNYPGDESDITEMINQRLSE